MRSQNVVFFFIVVFFTGSASSCLPSLPAVNVDQDLDQDQVQDSEEYLEALARATAELQEYIMFCKSCIMMETCFDITSQQVE